MERDSYAYKIRRKCQVLAHNIITNEALSKIYFFIVMHKKLDLKNPSTFNEKIQWMKLYYYPYNPLVIKCTDKYLVRDYIQKKGFGDKLVPLLGTWEKVENIDWKSLPSQFVLKCNHGCAYNIVVTHKESQNQTMVFNQLQTWLKEDFGAFNLELHYSAIHPRRIICERYLGDKIIDYKFFCFNGKPSYIYVSTDLLHDRQAQIGFFYLDGSKMPLHRDDYQDIEAITLPPYFEEMKHAAEVLSEDFPFVRVDFFVTKEKWYFAELTFTPSAGMMPFNPKSFDLEWGKNLDLSGLTQ